MAKWIKYTGSDEQIAEMLTTKTGFIVDSQTSIFKDKTVLNMPVTETPITWLKELLDDYSVKKYLICEPHPLADMIKIWADTGCEVYVCEHHNNYYDGIVESTDCFYHPPTNKPDWNIPGAEYRLTPFEEEV